MAIREKLEKLRQSHYVCEDCWYSCPKSGECCNDTDPHDYCNCGADTHNALVDEIIAEFEEELTKRYLKGVQSGPWKEDMGR